MRERLLILPISGVLDADRADQLTEQLVRGSRTHHPKVVVINITGAPDVDATVANHLVQTVDTSRLRVRASSSPNSPTIAQTRGALRVDLSTIPAPR